MRVLRLIVPEAYALEFHPYVTVVSGLDDKRRDALVSAFESTSRGVTGGNGGLIEAHGIVLDLDDEMLRILELTGVELDTIVTAEDLPGSSPTGVARQLEAAEGRLGSISVELDAARSRATEVETAHANAIAGVERAKERAAQAKAAAADGDERLAELTDLIGEADAVADRHKVPVGDAAAEVAAARDELQRTRAELEEATRLAREDERFVSELETDIAAARDRRDPFAQAASESAKLALDETQRALDRERSDEERERAARNEQFVEDPREHLERVETEIEALRQVIDMFAAFDPAPVRDALEMHVRGPDETLLVPSPQALILAEQLESVERRFSAARDIEGPPPWEVDAAKEAVVKAQEVMFEAERAVRMPQLEPEDVKALEDAHEEVLAAQDRSEGRFGGQRTERRLEEAREVEVALLDKLGFATYSDYMMGTSILHVNTDDESRLEKAAKNLAKAEDERTRLTELVEAELEVAALVDQRRTLRETAWNLVGPGVADRDLIVALQDLRVPDDPEFSPIGELRSALAEVGLPVEEDAFSSEELVGIAELWLDEYARSKSQRDAAVDRLQALDDERVIAVARVADESDEVANDPEQARATRLHEVTTQLRLAEERCAVHERAEADLARFTTALETATAALAEQRTIVDELAAAEAAAVVALENAEAFHGRCVAAHESDLEAVAELTQQRDDLRRQINDANEVDFDEEIAIAEAAVLQAETSFSQIQASLTERTASHRNLVDEVTALRSAVIDLEGQTPEAEEVEWYLLARLASQRNVSFAGSVPLVLIDALGQVADEDLPRLLDRLERMAGAVQVIHVTDHPGVLKWAEKAGEDRVAVVSPVAPREYADATS